MKQFFYKAATNTGQRIQGRVEAKDQSAAVEILREKQLLVLELKDAEANWKYQLNIRFSRVTAGELVSFTRQFATMIQSGLPIITALELIRKRSSPALSTVINQVAESVQGGESLYKALSQHEKVFPPIYLSLVKAGEMAGALGVVLTRMAKTLEKQREFVNKVKAALLYPIIVVLAMFIVGGIMIFFVIPKMAELYQEFDADLPFYTQLMIDGSMFIRAYWYLVGILMAGLGYGLVYALKTPKGKILFDRLSLSFPYLGTLTHKVISTNMLRTLALLISSGVAIIESLQVVSDMTANRIYQQAMKNIALNVEKGVPLAASFAHENVFPEVVNQMITVGEETGKLDEMIEKIALQFEKDSVTALKAVTGIIEPAMIVVIGIGIGFMVISIIVPIYNLTSAI